MPQVAKGWSLIIERGREPGRRYALKGSSVVLGASPEPSEGLALMDQEGNSPKRMAPRQALLEAQGDTWTLRDLDSAGGTFVNRQRVLSGQARLLSDGDVIQLGSVHLKLNSTSELPSIPNVPKTECHWPLLIGGGMSCRSFDEILPVSAQRWTLLRDELVKGELATKLVAFGRPDLAPRANHPGSADERLDAWLSSLPTTKPAQAEIEVHPQRLVIASAPGSAHRRTLQISNVGFGLLRIKARVEPASAAWLKVVPPWNTETHVVDAFTGSIEVIAPDSFTKPVQATLVLETRERTCRVEVVLEPTTKRTAPGPSTIAGTQALGIFDRWQEFPLGTRLFTTAIVAAMLRLLIGLANLLIGDSPTDLRGPILVFAGLGAILGLATLRSRARGLDLAFVATAGAGVGLILAVMIVAVARAGEPILGSLSTVLPVVVLVWGLVALPVSLMTSHGPNRSKDKGKIA